MIDLMTRGHLIGPEDFLKRLHEPGSVLGIQSGEGDATVSEHVDVVLVTQACHGVLGQARVALQIVNEIITHSENKSLWKRSFILSACHPI